MQEEAGQHHGAGQIHAVPKSAQMAAEEQEGGGDGTGAKPIGDEYPGCGSSSYKSSSHARRKPLL
jgi:hypothetical protein